MHCGHLCVAEDVKRRLKLDHMFLMPAAQSPLKAQHSVAATHRVAMLELALGVFPELALDLREIDRAGPSFTVDSLSEGESSLAARQGFTLLLAMIAYQH